MTQYGKLTKQELFQVQGEADETVGEHFDPNLLQLARDRTLSVILECARRIQPGMTEDDAHKTLKEVQTAAGAPKSWHPPQIRFGRNTLLPFNQKDVVNPTLQDNDVFFFDIGPIFDGHEGDVGRPFFVGSDSEMKRCCEDAETIWHEVQAHWKNHKVSGEQLYNFAKQCAEKRGWLLNLQKANGHRISDFPHAAKARGSIEGFKNHPAANRWILEIQIRHPERPFGAFYEDLLN